MGKLRHDQKRDANEAEIVDALEAMGCTVDRQPAGEGRPDLLVGEQGHDCRMEVKVPGEQLSPRQREYHAAWKGAPIYMVWSVSDAIAIIAQRRKDRRKK